MIEGTLMWGGVALTFGVVVYLAYLQYRKIKHRRAHRRHRARRAMRQSNALAGEHRPSHNHQS
jgi:RNase P protein component